MSIVLLLALALAPGACIIIFIYFRDKHEKEPIRLLFLSFVFGILSVFLTLLISWPLNLLFSINEHDAAQQAIHAFFLVALVEELSKFVYVRGILYRDSNFNEPFDGIVYSVMVSMGFATFENIMYVVDGGFGVGVLRMFTAVPAHATFAVLMGYYLGKAKFEHRKEFLAIYGLLVAALFHGLYDYFWFISYVPGLWVGAIVSLLIAVIFSRKAIKIHQEASPFHPRVLKEKEDAALPDPEIKNPGSPGS